LATSTNQHIEQICNPIWFLKKLKSFNPQMEHLSIDLKHATHEDLNIYAFGKGLSLENWVRFSFHHIESYPTWFIS
jgi:hypothetical protein